MYFLVSLIAILLSFSSAEGLIVVTVPPRGSVEVGLTPNGSAELEWRGTVARVRIDIDRAQPASAMGAAMNTYVAWAVSPEGAVENLGEVALDDSRLRLEATTRFHELGILITAEPHYMVNRPGASVAYRSIPPRDDRVRRITATVDAGVYDYSSINPAPSPFSLVRQARAAFDFAMSAGADRLAEGELRLARVALDTMEEMLSRRAPFEIIDPTAREAIRAAHRAFLMTLEADAAQTLESAQMEAADLARDKDELATRLDALTEEHTAAQEQLRTLEARLAAAVEEGRVHAAAQAQTAARLQSIQRELDELRRKQELEKPSSIRLPDEYVHAVENALTPAGKEALSKIVSTADLWTGPLRIEGSARTLEVAKAFFAESGLPPESIVFIPAQ